MSSDHRPPTTAPPSSPLRQALREAVGLVQMVVYKSLRTSLPARYPDLNQEELALLAGSLTGELFGSQHPGERYRLFRRQYRGTIEQALLAIAGQLADLREPLTDALRIQTLCDHQEGVDSTATLVQAKSLGLLVEEREVPLPSNFMQQVRELGRQQQLLTPQTTPDGADGRLH